MKYEDIKTYAERCNSHPDHQTGIITNQMITDRLLDEIEELRGFIEAKSKPLTEEQIKPIFDQWKILYGGYTIDLIRAIERAHGIGGKE